MAFPKPLFWLLLGWAFLAITLTVASYRGQALTARPWIIFRSVLTSLVALGTVKFSLAGRGIMDIKARWERALLRWLFLLAVAINVLPCFIAMDYVAHVLHLGATASHSWAVVVVAVHLYFGWVAIFGK